MEAEIQPWLESNRPAERTTFDTHSSLKSLWVDEPLSQPPVHFGLVVGDCLHNLRSALDNLVYALAVKNNKGPLDDEIAHRPMFLIEDKRENFRKRKWRLNDIAPEARQYIEEMQQFNQAQVTLERNPL